jgi:hypothetical protein
VQRGSEDGRRRDAGSIDSIHKTQKNTSSHENILLIKINIHGQRPLQKKILDRVNDTHIFTLNYGSSTHSLTERTIHMLTQ